MERLVVEGGHPLHGEIVPAGNKNAAQPMLAACLLTGEPVVLHNVPNIEDVRTLRGLGVSALDFNFAAPDADAAIAAMRQMHEQVLAKA